MDKIYREMLSVSMAEWHKSARVDWAVVIALMLRLAALEAELSRYTAQQVKP